MAEMSVVPREVLLELQRLVRGHRGDYEARHRQLVLAICVQAVTVSVELTGELRAEVGLRADAAARLLLDLLVPELTAEAAGDLAGECARLARSVR